MTDEPQTQATLESWETPPVVKWTSPYLKRLIIERHLIREALLNPGGSVIVGPTSRVEVDAMNDYSPVIGNTFHLDLIDAMTVLDRMDAVSRKTLLAWCDGLPSQTAAEYANLRPETIRKRANLVAKEAVERLNDDSTVKITRVA